MSQPLQQEQGQQYYELIAATTRQVVQDAAASMSSSILVAGLTLHLWSSDEAVHHAISDAFAHSSPTGATPAMTVYAWSSRTSGVPMPAPPTDNVDVALRGELLAIDGSRYRFAYLTHARMLLAADLEARVAHVIVDNVAALRGFDRASPLRGPLGWLLPVFGRFLVHAGGLVSEDHAVMLLGRSGAGKSTLALQGLTHGWDYLGDDLIAVDGQGCAYGVYGTAKTIASDTLIVPSHTQAESWQDPGGKRVHQLWPHYASQMCAQAHLRALVLVDRSSDSLALRPLSPSIAVSILAATTHSLIPGAGVELLHGLSQLGSVVPAWRLCPGPDPKQTLDVLATAMGKPYETPIA